MAGFAEAGEWAIMEGVGVELLLGIVVMAYGGYDYMASPLAPLAAGVVP